MELNKQGKSVYEHVRPHQEHRGKAAIEGWGFSEHCVLPAWLRLAVDLRTWHRKHATTAEPIPTHSHSRLARLSHMGTCSGMLSRHDGQDTASKHPLLRMAWSCCRGTVRHMLSIGSCHQLLSDCCEPPAACSTHSAAVKPGFGRSRQNRQRPCCSGSAADVKLMLPTGSLCRGPGLAHLLL